MASNEIIVKREPMKETTKITKNDFELLKTVGKGSFGKVFQVRMFLFCNGDRCDIKAMGRSTR